MPGEHSHHRGVDYDRTADEYAAHRQIHPGVYEALCAQVGPGGAVLEVGCGTGNYIAALSQRLAGRSACGAWGLDPSQGMLAHARARPAPVTWIQGLAQLLPFAPEQFDLIFSVDVIHHVADAAAYYRQAARALRPGGGLCTATDSAEIIRQREILAGYFPQTIEVELARYPRLAQLLIWMDDAGLADLEVITVEQPYQLTSAQAFRDKAFSSLHFIADDAWRVGLARLERDLARGPVPGVSRYACVWGRKPA